MSIAPDITVVVPHYNDPGSLALCLDALDRQTMPRDRFEIVVADNASPMGLDAIREVINGRARVIEVSTPGAGPARNGGASEAHGVILAFTDCDCVPEPGWLAGGMAALRPGTLVGGRMTVQVANRQRMTAAEAFEAIFAFDNESYVSKKHFTVTANLFVHKDDFLTVGAFRTGVSEDMEWCLRARSLGLGLIYARDAVVGHPARRTWPELRRKWDRLVVEQYSLIRERRGVGYWLLRCWILPFSIVAHLPRVLTAPAVPRRRDRMKAAAMLIWLRLWRFYHSHLIMFRRAG